MLEEFSLSLQLSKTLFQENEIKPNLGCTLGPKKSTCSLMKSLDPLPGKEDWKREKETQQMIKVKKMAVSISDMDLKNDRCSFEQVLACKSRLHGFLRRFEI